MKSYVYVGCDMGKMRRSVKSVKIVQHASDKEALSGVLYYLEFAPKEVNSVMIWDEEEDSLVAEVVV